ncbi:MAG: Spy/CpxP family protein refolding chaperone [Desulfuromusa sp.]|jgi:Spy/CpxP family protein refolding chaperone|nr:Spy/CpxP family protein refolding chaperone [Desulfuromusa sp.]
MKKRIIISTVLIGTLMTGGIAMAKSFGSGSCNGKHNSKGQGMMTEEQHQQRAENRLERMDVILDLSDSQEKQIKALFSNKWQGRQAVRAEMREGRDERRTGMRSGDLDEAALRSNLAKQAEFKADRIVERAQVRKELYAILTPEQQKKAEKIWATHGSDRKGRSGKGFAL